jgi:hypothetical protein
MPTHIEHVVTEVVPESSGGGESNGGDKRWAEQMKTQAQLKQWERHSDRLRAEGFDD